MVNAVISGYDAYIDDIVCRDTWEQHIQNILSSNKGGSLECQSGEKLIPLILQQRYKQLWNFLFQQINMS